MILTCSLSGSYFFRGVPGKECAVLKKLFMTIIGVSSAEEIHLVRHLDQGHFISFTDMLRGLDALAEYLDFPPSNTHLDKPSGSFAEYLNHWSRAGRRHILRLRAKRAVEETTSDGFERRRGAERRKFTIREAACSCGSFRIERRAADVADQHEPCPGVVGRSCCDPGAADAMPRVHSKVAERTRKV
jgi:hypothetical protein